MVGEAKAFCPSCGHAFVEETARSEESEFESVDHTMQFGQTMYNQMLSDMGLNISKTPEALNQEVQPALEQVLQPAAAPQQPSEKQPQLATQSFFAKYKWLIIGLAIFVVLFAVLVIIAAAVIIYRLQPN